MQGIIVQNIASCSDATLIQYRHSFLGILTQHFPRNTLSSALRSYLSSSLEHHTTVNTAVPPTFVVVVRVLQTIGLTSMTELELSVVVAQKVREFVNVELRGNWETQYSNVLTTWVEEELGELLRYVLMRESGESVGEEALKTIALRALTDLR